jgi:hypothetical protein
VSEELPVEAFAGTVKVTCADAPAAILSGDEGELTTPVGKPVNATDTVPENPFDPVIETVTGALVMPPTALTEVAETEMEKSPAGGGGGVEDELLLPPQPVSSAVAAIARKKEILELTLAICFTSRRFVFLQKTLVHAESAGTDQFRRGGSIILTETIVKLPWTTTGSDGRSYRRARSITQSVQKEEAPLASRGALPCTASTKFSMIG